MQRTLGLLICGFGVFACAHGSAGLPTVDDAPYRIGPEDVLEVSVWRDADMSRLVPVRPDGYISLPLIGEVKAEGKTPHELSTELSESFSSVLQTPRVTVLVREVNAPRVFVTGEVSRPGSYLLRGRMSLLQAIALAGGFSTFADREGIVVIRPNSPEGRYVLSYTALVDGAASDVFLRSGDTVVVP